MVPILDIVRNLDDDPWTEIQDYAAAGKLINACGNDTQVAIGALPRGTTNGKTSVAIKVTLPGGAGMLICETTLALFLAAADALRAAYPEG